MTWRYEAACLGLDDLMLDPARTGEARALCAGCPVAAPCSEWVGRAPMILGVVAATVEADRGIRTCANCDHPHNGRYSWCRTCRVEANRYGRIVGPVARTCQECGTEFVSAHGNARYCRAACRNTARRAQWRRAKRTVTV